ncbi:MAG: hypothetical protein D6806_03425 [Deltaproteobacteria bacterium]|nr:MAG: hypothetical protein D6806_03425 [Deltaproteobacteria bacterium]
MGLKEQLWDVLEQKDRSRLERLVASHARAVRYLLGWCYHERRELRAEAIRGLVMSADHHPRLVRRVVERLVWAMNEESGTNAYSAPDVLLELARSKPELVEPVIPELNRVAQEDCTIGDRASEVLQLLGKNPDVRGRWPEVFAVPPGRR